jgi:hypothetical protein
VLVKAATLRKKRSKGVAAVFFYLYPRSRSNMVASRSLAP